MKIKKATPAQMLDSLSHVQYFQRAGIRFVAIPALDDNDYAALLAQMDRRAGLIIKDRGYDIEPGYGLEWEPFPE